MKFTFAVAKMSKADIGRAQGHNLRLHETSSQLPKRAWFTESPMHTKVEWDQGKLDTASALAKRKDAVVGVASENGKNRTVSRWHGLASRKRSFLRGFNENQIRASAGMACCFLENHSRIARLKQPSFENHENAVSRGWQLAQSRAVAGYRIS